MSVDHSPVELPPGLLAEYRESARLQLQLVAELADRLAVAGNDPDALSRLHQETHKIHGSAGSYGFWPASRLAAGMEETVKDWVARPNDADMDRGSMTQWFVVQLAEALELEPPDPPAHSRHPQPQRHRLRPPPPPPPPPPRAPPHPPHPPHPPPLPAGAGWTYRRSSWWRTTRRPPGCPSPGSARRSEERRGG